MKDARLRVKRAVKELLGMPQRPLDHGQRLRALRARSFEEQIYIALLCQNDTCVDVGANTGEISILMSELAGQSGSVLALEPVWPTYRRLCANVQRPLSTRAPIVTLPLGLSDSDKVATIQVPHGDFGMGSLAIADAWSQAQSTKDIVSYRCRFTTLDELLLSTGISQPDFLKIDVEGAELFVLHGARNLLSTDHVPLMLIELFAPWERAFNYGPWEVLSMLSRLGYHFLFACPTGLVEHQPSSSNPFPRGYELGYNVIAFHESHAARINRVAGLRVGGGETILPMVPPPVPNILG